VASLSFDSLTLREGLQDFLLISVLLLNKASRLAFTANLSISIVEKNKSLPVKVALSIPLLESTYLFNLWMKVTKLTKSQHRINGSSHSFRNHSTEFIEIFIDDRSSTGFQHISKLLQDPSFLEEDID
jgi:hypothetical protein